MNARAKEKWLADNQRALAAEVNRLREVLTEHARRASGADEPRAKRRGKKSKRSAPSRKRGAAPAALQHLGGIFNLSSFEREVLLLCAAFEVDPGFGSLCAAARGENGRAAPTFGLALAVLPEAHWSALTPAAPLRRWRLLEVGAGLSLTESPLRMDERILHYLTGINQLDQRLANQVRRASPGDALSRTQVRLAQGLVKLWENATTASACPVAHLAGSDAVERLEIVAHAAAAFGVQVYTLRVAAVSELAAEQESLARLWEREARLLDAVLCLEVDERDSAEHARKAERIAELVRSIVVISGGDGWQIRRAPVVRLTVPARTTAEQKQLWKDALGPAAARLDGSLDMVASHFRLRADQISAVGALVRPLGRKADAAAIWELCRQQARPRLDDLAQRLKPAAKWTDLVVPKPAEALLKEIATHVRQRTRVHERWGFAKKGNRGLGLCALFSGASGTGKTMAAEVIAQSLGLDLYRIDLSAVVSKYIGETEKNLRRVFDAAEESGAILLFDEADALFGKRSDVKDSHDRYANIEVSYLLQRVEAYQGLVVLTTNLKQSIDDAFLRRIRFVVSFPFPDAAQRAEIWRRIFPKETPTARLDWERLAQLNVAGGNIRNIALNAAFLAAEDACAVGMKHLLRAARTEYQKLERPMTSVETKGWEA